jgi:hypothetical protein
LPTSSAINYAAGQTRTNNTVVGLNAAGALAAQCLPGGSTHLIVDVNGYFEGLCPAPTQSCYTGPPGTEALGSCHPGTQTCVDGTLGPCLNEVTPIAESCNGVDDDCNGQVDDGNPGGGAVCNTGFPGVCAPGTTACSGGALSCVANVLPGTLPEVCNGVDDNCDGTVDEGCP